jgi:FkbM family methyltransferase
MNLSQEHPLTLVDVGSSGGIALHWRAVKNLTVVEFEPDARAPEPLRDWPAKRLLLRTALWESAGEMDFYLTEKQQGSSLFQPNHNIFARYPKPERVAVRDARRVRVDTLTHQLESAGVEWVDFIKLDAQGAELAILKGAEKFLRHSVSGLEIEVEFLPLYGGQPLFAEVDAFVRGLGFELFELRPTQWHFGKAAHASSRGQLAFADALYFRGPEKIESVRQRQSLSALAHLYGRPDFAAFIEEVHAT